MTTTCKNCEHHFEGKFCFNCGQAANTHKLNSHFLWHDIQHGIFHFDKGLVFSAKELFTRPGATIREYIDGKRVSHFRPISMLVLLATVYGLLYHFWDISPDMDSLEKKFNSGKAASRIPLNMEAINTWVAGHFALVTLLQLPFYALTSWLIFRKSGYNYVEHLVMNAFLAAQRLMVQLVILPLEYFYNRTVTLIYISSATVFVNLLLLVWGYTTFFHRYTTGKAVAFSILSYVLVLLMATLISILVGIILALVWVSRHPH